MVTAPGEEHRLAPGRRSAQPHDRCAQPERDVRGAAGIGGVRFLHSSAWSLGASAMKRGTVGLVAKLRGGKENLIKTTDALLFWGVYVYGGVITDWGPTTCQVEYSSLMTLSKTRWWTNLGEKTAEPDASPPAWRTREGVSGQQAPRHRDPGGFQRGRGVYLCSRVLVTDIWLCHVSWDMGRLEGFPSLSYQLPFYLKK